MTNNYSGFRPTPDWKIDRVDASSLMPQDFYKRFVATRTPVVLINISLDQFPVVSGQRLSPALLRKVAGDDVSIKVESRGTSGNFGSGQKRNQMTVAQLLDQLEGGNEDLYLTTQYTDPEEEEGTETSSRLPTAVTDWCQPPLTALLGNFPRRPRLLDTLVPQQVNLWMGRSKDGSSSGLHHDHADNIYALLCGKKRFTLFCPGDVDKLYVVGDLREVFENGFITYVGGPKVRADGAKLMDVAKWKLANEREDDESEADEEMDRALDTLLAEAGEAGFEDDFDGGDSDGGSDEDGDGGSEEEDSDEEEEEEEDEELALPGLKRRPSDSAHEDRKKANTDTTASEATPNADPATFSKIPVSVLHGTASKKETSKFPLLAQATRVTVDLEEGEMLYLPSSWLHEVTSISNESNGGLHMAMNWWMHPPTTKDYKNPYVDEYWESQWADVEKLLDSN